MTEPPGALLFPYLKSQPDHASLNIKFSLFWVLFCFFRRLYSNPKIKSCLLYQGPSRGPSFLKNFSLRKKYPYRKVHISVYSMLKCSQNEHAHATRTQDTALYQKPRSSSSCPLPGNTSPKTDCNGIDQFCLYFI